MSIPFSLIVMLVADSVLNPDSLGSGSESWFFAEFDPDPISVPRFLRSYNQNSVELNYNFLKKLYGELLDGFSSSAKKFSPPDGTYKHLINGPYCFRIQSDPDLKY
jgi:hypothetical protein